MLRKREAFNNNLSTLEVSSSLSLSFSPSSTTDSSTFPCSFSSLPFEPATVNSPHSVETAAAADAQSLPNLPLESLNSSVVRPSSSTQPQLRFPPRPFSSSSSFEENKEKQICHMRLPDRWQLANEKKRLLQLKINETYSSQTCTFNYLSIQSLLDPSQTSSEETRQLVLEILFEYLIQLICNYPRELPFTLKYQLQFLVFLTLAPILAYYKDENDLQFIHYLCMMEYPDPLILSCLLNINPEALGEYGRLGSFLATPFHLILMKSEINFSVAFLMSVIYPKVIKMKTFDGKFPLHLALGGIIQHQSFSYDQYLLVKQLLSHDPNIMFHNVQEEMNSLIPINMSLTEVFQSPDPNDDYIIFIDQQPFKIETQSVDWNPYDRAMSSNISQVRKFYFCKASLIIYSIL